jgi:hypothetical protein
MSHRAFLSQPYLGSTLTRVARSKRTQGLLELKNFLTERFSEYEIRSIAQSSEVAQAIPGATVSTAQLADELVSTLERRDALDMDFFEALREERPNLVQKIDSLADSLLGKSQAVSKKVESKTKAASPSKAPSKRRRIQESLKAFRAMLTHGGYYEEWDTTVKVWADEWKHWMKENLSPTHFQEWAQAVQRPKGSFLKSHVDVMDEAYNRIESLLAGLSKVYA